MDLLVKLVKYSSFVALSGITYIVFFRIDYLFFSNFSTDGQAGFYSVAMSLVEGFTIIPSVSGMVMFAKLTRQSDQIGFRKVLINLSILSVLSIPGFALIYHYSDPLIHLIYGDEFVEAGPVLKSLMPGCFFLCITTILQNILGLTQKTHLMLWGPLAALVVKVLLFTFTSDFSATNLGQITSIGLGIWLVVSFALAIRLNPAEIKSAQ